MTLPIDIKNQDLSSVTERDGATLTTRFVGTAETPSRVELGVYLGELHRIAVSEAVTEVIVDLRTLEFMNSSCFKAFVVWIGNLQDAPSTDQYRVRFLADEKKHWQNRSLAALACFAIDLVSVAA